MIAPCEGVTLSDCAFMLDVECWESEIYLDRWDSMCAAFNVQASDPIRNSNVCPPYSIHPACE